MKKLFAFLVWSIVLFWSGTVFSAQGQWGGFLYLIPNKPGGVPASPKKEILQALNQAAQKFSSDFTPSSKNTETLQYYTATEYSLNGRPVEGSAPSGMIRVESMNRGKIDDFLSTARKTLKNYYDIEFRLGVARELNYTDAQTLARLKENAPKRGDGTAQPNAVIFPLSKTPDWWKMTQEKRQQYFSAHPEIFGKAHQGHNGIGFQYITQIFRKLYHSRFYDSRQDFVTYFEFADSDRDTFQNLLNGLRDKTKNQEWKFVVEQPIFWGKRVASPDEII